MQDVSAPSADELAEGVFAGERRAIARAITLVESQRARDRETADELLDRLAPRSGSSLRLAVSGPPGVGKSTLIDVLGRYLVERGGSVAVLAVDPSSRITGGSLLGDKTRMSRLAISEKAFIRPSPSGGVTGGIARGTREAVLVCEAAGFGTVVVETLGVGQTEHDAATLVDVFVLLAAPGAGDELQGMKRGILEVADVIAVNKADGADRERAGRAASEITGALGLFARASGVGPPAVLTVSARDELGISELWSAIERRVADSRASGAFVRRRAEDRRAWLEAELDAALRARWLATPELREKLAELEARVATFELLPRRALRELSKLLT